MTVDPGRRVGGGRYRLLKPIGQGGMASVFLAFDDRLQALRAVKVLAVKLAGHPTIRERFESEARTMAGLRHPNILAVHDVGAEDELVWIVMDLAEHGSLEDRVQRAGPLAPVQAATLVRAIVSALGAAHKNRVIHRDIKPQNILLGQEGEPLVTDFGIARVASRDDTFTRTGTILGTLAYMAPEQKTDPRGIDGRADLYAAGAMLFSVVTGEKPFDLYATEAHESRLSNIPEPLAEVIRTATRFRPEDRYQDATAFKTALGACIRELPHDPDDTVALVDPAHAVLAIDQASLEALRADPTLTPIATDTLDTLPSAGNSSETFVMDPADLTPPVEATIDLAPTPTGAESVAADESAGAPVPVSSAEAPGSPLTRLRAAAVLIALLGGGAWFATQESSQPAPTTVHEPPATAPTPAAQPEPEPTLDVEPVRAELPAEDAVAQDPQAPDATELEPVDAADPEPVEALAAPPIEQAPTTAPGPAPARLEEPAAQAIAPTPVPDPEPVASGVVRVSGDAESIRLIGTAGSFGPGEVPAGSYSVRVTFAGVAPFEALAVDVAPGATLTVDCNSAFSMCGVQ